MKKEHPLSREAKLIDQIGAKAQRLFLSKKLWCSEAVLVTLNQGFRGGLPHELAKGLTVGMGAGLGGSGCLCGAVNGAVVALGLFLAGCEPSKRLSDKTVRAHAKELKEAFKSRFGATCCRTLTRPDNLKGRSKHQCCADQTRFAAEYAARIILSRRPELIQKADLDYLKQGQNRSRTFLKIISAKRPPAA